MRSFSHHKKYASDHRLDFTKIGAFFFPLPFPYFRFLVFLLIQFFLAFFLVAFLISAIFYEKTIPKNPVQPKASYASPLRSSLLYYEMFLWYHVRVCSPESLTPAEIKPLAVEGGMNGRERRPSVRRLATCRVNIYTKFRIALVNRLTTIPRAADLTES